MNKVIAILVCAACLTGCASVFVPKRQKITITTGQENSVVYLDNEEFGSGSSIRKKTEKTGTKQIIVKTKDYKDNYVALVPTHRTPGFWICQVFNIPFDVLFFMPTFWDIVNNKTLAYDKVNTLPAPIKLVSKAADDKYIQISNIKLNINDKKKDIYVFNTNFTRNLNSKFEEQEKEKEADEVKAQLALEKNKKKNKKLLEETDNKIMYDDTRFSDNVYVSLKKSGFIDTVNKVFADNNNTLVLEGSVKKVYFFYVKTKDQDGGNFIKGKLFLTWYIKNTYGEVLDSIDTKELSGDFAIGSSIKDTYSKVCSDAIEISYLKLHGDARLKKHIKQSNKFDNPDPVLTLSKPASVITEKANAFEAAVIVKTGKGHGSGFAITNDGYIVTNYHVVAGRIADKYNTIKIITSQGDEVEGKVVRYNKFRDLALIKVDKKFEKVFKTSSVKGYKNMQSVYTIGAPKSIELGQSISSGVISNERKSNNNNLLQLGMSVNSGNSGGPLFDDAGNLHGVIVAKLVGENTEGVSFAVPGYLLEEYLKISFK